MSKMKMLAISPYSGMEPLLTEIAAEYPEIELTISVGDLASGLELAQKNFHADFDIILSRGGTAKLLKAAVSLPVVEIHTTVYDVLCTLRHANIHEGSVVIIGYSNITQDMEILRELLAYDIKVFTIDSSEQAVAVLQSLRQKQHISLLCDTVSYTIAEKMDFNAFLITSSAESIRTAFDQAVFFCAANRGLRSENQFLRQLLHRRSSHTIVFTQKGKLVFSSMEGASVDLLELLREKIDEVMAQGKIKVLQQLHGMLYHIEALQLPSESEDYIAFYFVVTTPPVTGDKYGIRYLSRWQLEQECSGSIYDIAGLTVQYHRVIGQANASRAPIFLFGAVGTGKEYMARILYLRSDGCRHPFLQIDCNLLSQKTWSFLLSHHSSPLCDTENTLYFQNLDALTDFQWRQLLAFLLEGKTQKYNRLIFSCQETENEHLSEASMQFMNRLSCFPFSLASLHMHPSQIETAFSLYLNHHTIDTGRQWNGIDAEAMTLLRQYPWAQNYLQFQRVMERLAAISPQAQIKPQDVQEALQPELSLAGTKLPSSISSDSLDLSLPLQQINQEIIRIVLEKNGGNQSLAAQSLGISRTTLWRMLKLSV